VTRPVALVTNAVPDYRREPFRLLDQAEGIDVIAWQETGQSAAARAIARGGHRAVIAGLGGKIALPGVYAAAKRTKTPFILWASLWEHPHTLLHRLSGKPLAAIYRNADAVVTYGPHVSRYVADQRGSATNVFEAPQAVDIEHFARTPSPEERAAARARAQAQDDDFLLLYVGRLVPEKGIDTLAAAWQKANLENATLAVAGEGPLPAPGTALGRVDKQDLPALYAAADALVLPSIRTATFTEPWGLVVNEAMLQGTPAITSDAVGAAAGGLVRDGRNGLIVPQGDATALAQAISDLAHDATKRQRLGQNAREDVAAYTPQAWADGMSKALAAVGASRQERN
jgi:glycosyltransferase involved in cell wall biosynthesis